MVRASPLTPDELDQALRHLPDWSVDGGALTRTAHLSTFPDAVEWVRAIADVAEAANHHPAIDIRWRTVTLRLCTHDAGDRITALDITLASQIDALPSRA